MGSLGYGSASLYFVVGVSEVSYAFPSAPTSDAEGKCYYQLKTPCNVQCNDPHGTIKVAIPPDVAACPTAELCTRPWVWTPAGTWCLSEFNVCLPINGSCSQVPSQPTPGG
jgi:hypothetical protein